MRVNEKTRKALSILLCLCMLLQNAPVMAFAATTDNLCDHHTEHTAECGYVEAVEGSDCTHSHDDTCGYVQAVDEVKCACEAVDENGALVHTEGCGYVAPIAGAPCAHSHDGSCGYVQAVEGHPCHYECTACADLEPPVGDGSPVPETTEDDGGTGNPSPTVCTCGTDDPAIHATFCDLYTAPEDPKCYCAEKCGVETQNFWCDVCGFDYTKCGGTDSAMVYNTTGECTWTFDEATGTLTISGEGDMADYSDSDTPWNDKKAAITAVVIEDGVTSIGSFAFYKCTNLTTVTIPSSVKSIGNYAFDGCYALKDLTISEGVESIGTSAFYACQSLTEISLPSTLTTLGDYPFSTCTKLTTVEIPKGVTTIGYALFENCTGLTSVTFAGNPETLGSDPFRGCTALTTITVPCNWSHAESYTISDRTVNVTKPGHTMENGECTVCGAKAQAKIGTTFYMTLAEAAAEVTEGGTIEVLTDVTIGADETLTFAAFATLDVAEGKTVTCNGAVKIGEAEGIIFENTLYYHGGTADETWDISPTDPPTYWDAGEGYAIFQPAVGEETAVLTLHNAIVEELDLVGDEGGAIEFYAPLTIRFSGSNRLTAEGYDRSALFYINGATVMEGIGKDAVLILQGGSDSYGGIYGSVFGGDLTVLSGTVTIRSGDGGNSCSGARVEGTLTVASGAVLNVMGGDSPYGISGGLSAKTIAAEGTINGLVGMSDESGSGCYQVYGNTVLEHDLNTVLEIGSVESYKFSFSVPAGTSLTVNSGVTLDLSKLELADIDFTGTVINNGTILLPADFALDNAPKSGHIRIGEKSYTWDSAKNRWICGENSHTGGTATCVSGAICTICGESYGEVDKTNHDTEKAEYDNGFCTVCDAYEPAELVNGVYQISNAGNLYWFADKVTNENAAYGSANAILTCDIRVNEGTMTEASTGARVWTPVGKIGLVGNQIVRYPYTGTFEGNGKTVSGLYFNDTSANFSVGLFSLVGEGGIVKNVGVADSYICGNGPVGAVAGSNYGTVTGCYHTGTVISSGIAGGVVGNNSGTVSDCHNSGTVSGESDVGGVVGSNIVSTGEGYYNPIVTDCYNSGTVSGSDTVGGVVGYSGGDSIHKGIVTGCYNTGTVSGESNVGGVVGFGNASNCYNIGTVSGTDYVGGVVGHLIGYAILEGCYNTGTVSGTDYVGGVAGYLMGDAILEGCYNTGTVSGEDEVGGVAGYNSATVTNCYFDSTVYTGDAFGTNSGTATNVEGKSTEQFASGEVAYLLSQGENGSIWGQDLDNGKTKQTTPTFTGAKVYCGYTSCGDTVAKYTNDETISAEKPDHTQKPTYTENGDGTHSASYSCCGTTVTEDHTLNYTANGNIITESCSIGCGHTGTATISATGKTYDGNAVEVTVSKTGSLENTVIPVTLTKDGEAFTGEPVNAGTYTASITLGESENTATASVDFAIAKAAVSIATAPTPNTLTYIGEAQYLISAGEAVGGTMVYNLTEEGEYTTSIPQGTNAGDYKVWYYVQGDANHKDSGKDSVSVGIAKAPLTVTADAKIKSYGDEDPPLTYTAEGLLGGDTLTSALTGALSREEGENVGSYAITLGTLSADNYTISFVGADLTIQAKEVTDPIVTLEQDSYAYDGTAKEPEVTSIIVDGVKLTEDVDYRVLSYERNIYVGEAEVVIHFMGNYRGSLSRFFQITKAPLTVTADSKTMTTGQELPTFTYTITGFVGGESEDVLTAKPTVVCVADGKTAGTYDITVSGAAADNYEITHVNGTLTVADHQHAWTYTAKDDTITATCNAEGCPDAEQSITISAVGKIYDGTPVTATLTGSIDGVATPEITYTGNTNAGTHTASITIEGKTASVKFTIERATVTVTADAKSKPYGTDNPTLTYTSEGLLGDDALTGALETTATKTSSVGEYDITVGSLANSNYTIDFVGAKLTITKAAAPEIQWPTAAALTYGQKLSDSTLTSQDENGTFAWQDGSIVPTVTNDGYVVVYTPKDTDNYDYTVVELTKTIPVTVSKGQATVTAAPTPNTLTYTGEAQYLISAGEANGGTMQYQLNGGAWSASIPTAKDEGTYTVSWKVVGDANHADTDVKSITVTIGDCTHSGNTNKDDADCTTQVTCSVCGDVLVEAKAHVWGDWTTTLEPTTTTEGSKERLCTNDGCETKDTGSIPMLNEVEVPEEIVGGDVSVDNPTPATGDDVTITATPDTGKEVDEVIVTDKDGKEIPVTDNGDGTYTYEQPDGDVTVEVIIKDTIYTVTWIVDGTTYKTTQYKYGETITAPTDPTKAQSGCTTYTFDKWNGFTSGMTMPDNESLTFTAVFTEGESHIDENTDHICDRNCGKTDIEDHADPSGDGDHVCDYCRQPMNECSDVDTDKDHLCDECGAAMPKDGTQVEIPADDTGTITPGAPAEIDGKPIVIDWDGEIWLGDKDSKFLVTYKFNEDADPHKEYPTAMYAWLLKWEGETCKAIRIPELDNFMTYKGTSIRVNHSSDGIRFFTAVPVDTLNQAMKGTLLTGELEGYKLVEMGTLYKWAATGTELTVANGAKSYVYGGSAGSTYRQFSKEGSLSWFTGMLTDLPGDAETLAKDILSRPYAVFENADGDQITLYGGSVQRSIYYVALQNKDTWASGTAYDNYVEKIISTVEAAKG